MDVPGTPADEKARRDAVALLDRPHRAQNEFYAGGGYTALTAVGVYELVDGLVARCWLLPLGPEARQVSAIPRSSGG
jgi:hypothetical protein